MLLRKMIARRLFFYKMIFFIDGEKEEITILALSKKQMKKFIELCKKPRSALALANIPKEHLFLGSLNAEFAMEIKALHDFRGKCRECNALVLFEEAGNGKKYRVRPRQ